MSLMTILDRVADVPTFDKVLEPARRAVSSALRPQAVKDLLHGTWLGHPLHPVLVQVPVGSWTSAGLLDAVPPLRPAATVLIATGIAAAGHRAHRPGARGVGPRRHVRGGRLVGAGDRRPPARGGARAVQRGRARA